MNDFTKDELILILELLKGAYSVSLGGRELKAEKIISMIDNYCAHTNSNISFCCEDCELVL